MDNDYQGLINIERLNLIERTLTDRDKIKLKKKLDRLFNKSSSETKSLLNLFSIFDKPNTTPKNNYTIGDRVLVVVKNQVLLNKAIKDIKKSTVIGFDTEQKPTFKRGEKQKPISIIQIATKSNCYVIQVKHIDNLDSLAKILSDKNVLKVGFGLGNDSKQLELMFGEKPKSLLDLSTYIKKNLLSKNPLGAKNAVSSFLNMKILKSKSSALSNWENRELSTSQVKYAAEDATAPLDVYNNIKTRFKFLKLK